MTVMDSRYFSYPHANEPMYKALIICKCAYQAVQRSISKIDNRKIVFNKYNDTRGNVEIGIQHVNHSISSLLARTVRKEAYKKKALKYKFEKIKI